MPIHAQLPALGLSNRGASSPYDISSGDTQEANNGAKSALPATQDGSWNEISNLVKELAEIDHLTELPYEEILLQSTLWWETNKLFGHSNELFALSSDSSGKFIASASKANRCDLAKIFIWECEKFRKVATIEHHSLTVTRLKFSPNDNYLLSVSRDRTWSLSERTGQLRNAYKLLCGTTKSNASHERIIWDCCWTYDSDYFMTVSRDKKAILWSVAGVVSSLGINKSKEPMIQQGEVSCQSAQTSSPNTINCATMKVFTCPIQAVDSLPLNHEAIATMGDIYLFAFGFEDGKLDLYSVSKAQYQWTCLRSLEGFHQFSIRRLAFRPSAKFDKKMEQQEAAGAEKEDDGRASVLLASGAEDCVVKLIKMVLDTS